jgi:tyrosine-protein phosphatase YwqE
VINWFKKKTKISTSSPLTVDIHSHLLPLLDDGVKSFEESEEIITHFQSLGYRKIITTPHVMSDAYRNTPEGILEKLKELNAFLKVKGIDITIEAAAEYYLDEYLFNLIETDKQILTFGKRYLLFETNFLTEPLNLKEFIFLATTKGYKLILAHPERYLYLQNNLDKAQDLINRGVLFQLNISSLTGYYAKSAKQTANKLIDQGWVHFLGSDCHHLQHIKLTKDAQHLKYFKKALSLPLLNNSL